MTSYAMRGDGGKESNCGELLRDVRRIIQRYMELCRRRRRGWEGDLGFIYIGAGVLMLVLQREWWAIMRLIERAAL